MLSLLVVFMRWNFFVDNFPLDVRKCDIEATTITLLFILQYFVKRGLNYFTILFDKLVDLFV